MIVLFLGNIGSPIIDVIRSNGDEVVTTTQPLSIEFIKQVNPGFIVSFGYPHLVSKGIIEFLDGKIINLHLSYLPWNRGSDPDLWSLIDDTPKGVTIHFMDENFDTGDIIVQKKITPDVNMAFAAYGDLLKGALIELFEDHWKQIAKGDHPATPQEGEGSYHRSVDKADFIHLLTEGSETPIGDINRAKNS